MSRAKFSFTRAPFAKEPMNPHDNNDVDEDDSVASEPVAAVQRERIDPTDEHAMRQSLAKEVISRSEKRSMHFDGVRREQLLEMSPNEVTERFLEIVRKKQGQPAADALAKAIDEEKRARSQPQQVKQGAATQQEAKPANTQRPTRQERTAPAPSPMVVPDLDKSALPLHGAATADMRSSIFAQAEQKQKNKPPKASTMPSAAAPKKLGINTDTNPKAAQSLQQLSKPIATRPSERGVQAGSTGIRIVHA